MKTNEPHRHIENIEEMNEPHRHIVKTEGKNRNAYRKNYVLYVTKW